MKAVFKGLTIAESDLKNYTPGKTPLNAALTVLLGLTSDENEEEAFEFTICTPDIFAKWFKSEGPVISGKDLLIVEKLDMNEIERFIRKICEENTGKSWHEIAKKIGRFGAWEFENYNE